MVTLLTHSLAVPNLGLLQLATKVTTMTASSPPLNEAQPPLPGWGKHTFLPEDDASLNNSPLLDTTFVVIDLETTGTSPSTDSITEIGAVKVSGGELLGEFSTLVKPARPIPPIVERLTGISNRDVATAPSLTEVFPSLLEFIQGSVLVAHNASFDISFLKTAAHRLNYSWPGNPTLCTVQLSRRILDRQEAPSVKLSALAQLFRTSQQPTHRALDDARTTVEVLHALIERVGSLDVTTVAELASFKNNLNLKIYQKRSMAAHLPHRPGVYIFYDSHNHPLYIGTATDLKRRVMSYFNGSETRSRMTEMVLLSERVDYVECLTSFEASIRELRLIGNLQPPYNRRSRNQKTHWWLVPAPDSPSALFKCQRRVPQPADIALGPFKNRRTVANLGQLLQGYLREGIAPTEPLTSQERTQAVHLLEELCEGNAAALISTLHDRLAALAADHRYEQAALLRDDTASAIIALTRHHRYQQLQQIAQLIVAERDGYGGWYFTALKHGLYAGTLHCTAHTPYGETLSQLVDSAQTIPATPQSEVVDSLEERHLVYRYVSSGTVRIVETSEPWAESLKSAGRHFDWAQQARDAKK